MRTIRLLGHRLGLLLIPALAFYLLTAAIVYSLQEQLLYHPSRLDTEDAQALASRNGLEVFRRADGELAGYVAEGVPVSTGTIVVFHGNAGYALHRLYYPESLTTLGYRVILAEYPGYGPREGDLSEESFVADALATLDEVRRRYDGNIIVWGESMGCGLASSVVREMPDDIAGAVLLTPWNNLPDVAKHWFWFLPARQLCRDEYDNVANLEVYQGPVVVILAGADEVIPVSLGREVYDAYDGPKYLIEFEGAGHNSWPAVPGLDWWKEAVDFIENQSNE